MDRDDALDYPMLYQKALAEVERLRGYIETLKTSQSSAVVNELNDEIARLRGELERDNEPDGSPDDPGPYKPLIERLRGERDEEIARLQELNIQHRREIERLRAESKFSVECARRALETREALIARLQAKLERANDPTWDRT